jgi:tRNA 5-methylaminomethyl-2-thiouridine biosynthesis bifunctional protein
MKILIIGAGIAGCTIANEMQNSGHDVYLIDQHVEVAAGTSSHAAALAHPHLTRRPARLQKFTRFANRMAYMQWQHHQKYSGAFQPLEQEDWLSKEQMQEKLNLLNFSKEEAVPLDASQAHEFVGINKPGIYYREAGIYDLKEISKTSIKNLPPLNLILGKDVKSIQTRDGKWFVMDANNEQIIEGDALILANGVGVKALLETLSIKLHLRPVRGQLSRFEISIHSPWAKLLPKVPMCGEGYCMPALTLSERHILWEVGSSYDEGESDLEPRQTSDEHNREQGRMLLNNATLPLEDLVALEPFVGIRSVSGDRLPLIGPVPSKPGLFIASAYGARGVLWSAVTPQLIARQVEAFFLGAAFLRAGFLTGATSAEESEFALAVAPARFLAGALTGRGSNSKPILPSG